MSSSQLREVAQQREIEEKKAVSESIRPVSSPGSNEDVESAADPSWAPGFWARFPWLGFIALITILFISGASVLTLMLSNNKSETQWVKQLPPNVILNQMNNVANLCFGLAIGNGVAIAWWRKTLQGATIKQLHRSWTFSTSIEDIIFAGRYFNFIALAALTAKLTIVDSSLMQKAFSTYIGMDQPHNVTNIFGHVNQTIPVTANRFGRSLDVTMSQALNIELQLWSQRGEVYEGSFENCEGTCYLDVPAAGFEINCTEAIVEDVDYGISTIESLSLSLDLSSIEQGNSPGNTTFLRADSSASTIAQAQAYVDAYSTAPLFRVNFTTETWSPQWLAPDGSNYSYISMNLLSTAAYDATPDILGQPSKIRRQSSLSVSPVCPGKVTRQSCRLRPAVISYPLQITNYTSRNSLNGIKLGTPSINDGNSSSVDFIEQHYDINLRQQGGFKILRYSDINGELDDNLNRLGGLQLGFETYLGGSASLTFGGAVGYQPNITGTAYKYLQDVGDTNENFQCGYNFINPLEAGLGGGGLTTLTRSVAASINQIMLLNTMKVPSFGGPNGWDFSTSGTLPLTAFNATVYRDTVHYSTNIYYMIGAVVANFICVLCVLPSYYGFWQLGRKVALSPFEIAAAFRSPMVDASGTIDDIIKEKGAQPVRFGHIVTGDAAGRLGVAEPEYVERAHPAIGSAKKEISEKITGAW